MYGIKIDKSEIRILLNSKCTFVILCHAFKVWVVKFDTIRLHNSNSTRFYRFRFSIIGFDQICVDLYNLFNK